jgi:hypothetical protein
MNIFKFLAPFLGLFSNHLRSRLIATNFLTFLLNATTFSIGEGAGSVSDQELLEKVRTKAGEAVDAKMNEYTKGLINRDEFKKSLQDIVDKTQEESVKVADRLKEITGILEKQGEMIKAFKQQDRMFERQLTRDEKIKLMIAYAGSTKAMEDYRMKPIGRSPEFKLTDALEALENKTIDLTNDYVGDLLITKPSGRVIDVPNRLRNVRDILNVISVDQPSIVGQEVYDWSDQYTGSASMLAENAAATEGSFKVKENHWDITRIAAFYDFSKRMLKTNGLRWLVGHISNVLPRKIKFVEDVQLLYGDGQGNNLTGMMADATQIDFAGGTILAGDIASVASWGSGSAALITFAADHGIHSGEGITLANTANYNGTYEDVVQVSATQIIISAPYVAEATAAWTGTYFNPFYKKIDDAQEIDVLLATAGTQRYKNRLIDAFLINSATALKMTMLKDNSARYLDKVQIVGDVLYVGGIPCIEVDAVTGGGFLGIRRGAEYMELAEFTSLNLFFTDDVTYAKTNQVCAIIEEEIIFPIYEPLSIVAGNFATLKAQLQV